MNDIKVLKSNNLSNQNNFGSKLKEMITKIDLLSQSNGHAANGNDDAVSERTVSEIT